MTEIAQQLAGAAWEVAGRRVAHSLDDAHSALVIGEDATATASAALGIARVQAARRRVAVADCIGEVPALQELVSDGDPHGITDSFQYGVSLSRVAHQVDEAGSLYIIPTGAEPVITDEVLRSERWRLLADRYRADGGLLLIVAPPHAPGVSSLARFVGGLVLAGDVDVRMLGDVRVLTVVAPPADQQVEPESLDEAPAQAPLLPPVAPRGPRRPTGAMRTAAPARRSRTVPLAAGGALAAAALAWFVLADREPADARPTGETASVAAAATPPVKAASAAGATRIDSAAGRIDPFMVVNPGDSGRAARFSVLVSTFPAAERARQRADRDAPGVPAATIAPAGEGDRHQYIGGAYAERREAEALLASLRRRSAVGTRGGGVVDRPLAFLVRSGVPADSAPALEAGFRGRRLSVYSLMQPDGSARLYLGAYRDPAQARSAAGPLRAAGVDPVLAYRTGTPR